MIELVKTAGIAILKKLIIAALSEQALKIVVIGGLEKLAKSTNNTIDDAFLEEIKKAL